MKDYFKNIYSASDFELEADKLVKLLTTYLNRCISEESMPILPSSNPQLLEEKYLNLLKKDKIELSEIFRNIIIDSNHLHHPNYIGHQVIPPLPVSALSEFLSSFLNNGMAIYEMGPVATVMERIVIKWMCDKLSFINGDGFLTSGGSVGNLTALLSAKQIKYNELIAKGLNENEIFDKLAIVYSGESHYSIDRTVKILGIKTENIFQVKFNESFKLDYQELQNVIKKAKDNKLEIFAVSINACSTALGIYDDIKTTVNLCKNNNIWLHVDAAHGGPAILSEKYKHLLEGINEADSVIIDFHKMMLCSALTTGVFYKDFKNSFANFEQEASYLLDKCEMDFLNGAKRTIECTKKSMSFKIYTILALYGEQIFENYINSQYDLAKEFANYLNLQDDFEIATDPQSNIVCFRYISNQFNLNELNRKIRNEVINSGEFYIVQAEINGELYLRVSIMNPLTDIENFKKLLSNIRQIVSSITI